MKATGLYGKFNFDNNTQSGQKVRRNDRPHKQRKAPANHPLDRAEMRKLKEEIIEREIRALLTELVADASRLVAGAIRRRVDAHLPETEYQARVREVSAVLLREVRSYPKHVRELSRTLLKLLASGQARVPKSGPRVVEILAA